MNSIPVQSHRIRPLQRASLLLEAGVPLTLLMDLADPAGPHSQDVYAAEPPDLSWLRQRLG